MKILYVQNIRLDEHTCKTSRFEMIAALQALGAEVTFVGGYVRRRPPVPPGFRVVLIPVLGVPVVGLALYAVLTHLAVLALVLRNRFDHVLLDPYTFFCAFPLDLAARAGWLRTRFWLDVRSGVFHRRPHGLQNRLRAWLRRAAFGHVARVFAGFTTISPMLRDRLVREAGVPAERVAIWQSGVALDRFDPERAGLPRPPGFGGRFVVMYHGSFGADRGLPETVEAMARLRATHPSVLLYLLGGGEEAARLRDLVARHGLEGSVVIEGAVAHEDVPARIGWCDVAILPLAPTEVMRSSSPLKLMEYLAMGKPVIVSRIEAFTGVLAGRDFAVFLDDVSPEAIARAIALAWERRHALAEAAREGRWIAEKQFTWDRQAERLWQFLSAHA